MASGARIHVANHAYDLLSHAQVGLIHRNALCILAEIGIEVQNRQLLELLRDHGAQLDFDTHRAVLPVSRVAGYIANCPKYDWVGAQGHAHAHG